MKLLLSTFNIAGLDVDEFFGEDIKYCNSILSTLSILNINTLTSSFVEYERYVFQILNNIKLLYCHWFFSTESDSFDGYKTFVFS